MQCSEHMALIRPVKPNLENSSAELYFASHEAEDSSQKRDGCGHQELAGVFSGVSPVVSTEER